MKTRFLTLGIALGSVMNPLAGQPEPITLESAQPSVVMTVPPAGSDSIDPKLSEIRVTFSKDMKNGTWSWARRLPTENFPATNGNPRYLDDKRTCVLPVKLEAEKTYSIWINTEKLTNFKDNGGRSAVPYLLVFKTKAGELSRNAPTASTAPKIDISPKSFMGKSLEECEKLLGKPTTDLKEQFAREYKPNVPGISRVRLQRIQRATECLDVTYYFPKGTIRNIAAAFSAIGLVENGAKVNVSWPSTGLSKEDNDALAAKSRSLQNVSINSALDSEFRRSIHGMQGGLEATWIPAASKVNPKEESHLEEDILIVKETYEQSEKRLQNK
jgi:RNA polymerase sigma-70 factor (ECF subfamily)